MSADVEHEVLLYHEQECHTVVRAPADASTALLTELALRRCDEGTAEFVATAGWTDRLGVVDPATT